MKKLISAVIVIALALSLLTVPGFALTEGDFEYTLQNNEAYITGYVGNGGDVVIPSEIRGVPVTKISSIAFTTTHSGNRGITSIHIPGTVKVIEQMAFQGIPTLESVYIEEGLETLGWRVFGLNDNLVSIHFPDSLTEIGSDMLDGCDKLTDVRLPSGLTYIPEDMFKGCASLTQIDLPDTIETIGKYAFSSSGLTSVVIPAGVKKIESYAFYYCKAFTEVTFLGTALTELGDSVFNSTPISQIILPVSLTKMGGYVFAGCPNITGVSLPYGLKSIGNAVFDDCPSLEWVYAPSTLTSVFADNFGESPNMIIYCPAGSAAEEACRNPVRETPFLTDASADSGIVVLYNGRRISFHNYGQNPAIVDSRTLVPLRSIFETMGATVSWDGGTRTVTSERGGVEISITIGESVMYVNGEAREIPTPAAIINDRAMVPARAIAEAFNATVGWNAPGYTVIITE